LAVTVHFPNMLRENDQSQHIAVVDQSEDIELFRRRSFIETGTNRALLTDFTDREGRRQILCVKKKLCFWTFKH